MKRAAAVALAAGALAAATAPAAHGATGASGSATITLSKSVHGVSVTATRPATRKGRAVSLPVTAAKLTSGAVVDTGGALTLRAGRRSVKLSAARLTLGKRSSIRARLGKSRTRTTVFTLSPNVIRLQAGSVGLSSTRVVLTKPTAKALERALKLKKALPRAFGTVKAAASVVAAQPRPSGPGTAPTPGPCRATTAGGTPPAPPAGEPPAKPQPAVSRAITSATITWHIRDSFIRYIATGEGTTASNGATAAPPVTTPETSAPLSYDFHFPSTGGWCDPATGAARLTFSGTVAFSYADHGIDMRANDPELELDGPASRLIFRMTGSADTPGGNKRSVLGTLDVSKATVSAAPDGISFTYDHIPAAVPPGAATDAFAGFYLPGDAFGWVSITFTTG